MITTLLLIAAAQTDRPQDLQLPTHTVQRIAAQRVGLSPFLLSPNATVAYGPRLSQPIHSTISVWQIRRTDGRLPVSKLPSAWQGVREGYDGDVVFFQLSQVIRNDSVFLGTRELIDRAYETNPALFRQGFIASRRADVQVVIAGEQRLLVSHKSFGADWDKGQPMVGALSWLNLSATSLQENKPLFAPVGEYVTHAIADQSGTEILVQTRDAKPYPKLGRERWRIVNVKGSSRDVRLPIRPKPSLSGSRGLMPVAFDSVNLRTILVDDARFYLYIYDFKTRRLLRLPAMGQVPPQLEEAVNPTQVTHVVCRKDGSVLVSFVKLPLIDGELPTYKLLTLIRGSRGYLWRNLGPFAILASTLDGSNLIVKHQHGDDRAWLVSLR